MSDDLVLLNQSEVVPVATWETILTAYLQTRDSKGTKRAYKKAIETALRELGGLDNLTALNLTAYRDKWVSRLSENSEHPLSPSSVALHLAALRSFLNFCFITGQVNLSRDVIEFTLKSPAVTVIKPYQVPTPREVNRIVVAAGRKQKPRDRMIFSVADATGLREAELANLKIGDLSLDDDGDIVVRVRIGKGRKDRIVPLEKDTAALVRSYLASRKLKLGVRADEKEFLFASRKGKGRGKLSTGHLRRLMQTYRQAAGIIKPVSMHSFRHGAAIRWLKSGGNVVVVQKLLGHSSLATTQKYLDHLALRDLKRVVNLARKSVLAGARD